LDLDGNAKQATFPDLTLNLDAPALMLDGPFGYSQTRHL